MKQKKYLPMGDRVVILRDQASNTTESGLFLAADPSKIPPLTEGTVVVIGDDPVIRVKVGDRVAFEPNVGREVQHLGQAAVVIQFMDIIAVVEHA